MWFAIVLKLARATRDLVKYTRVLCVKKDTKEALLHTTTFIQNYLERVSTICTFVTHGNEQNKYVEDISTLTLT